MRAVWRSTTTAPGGPCATTSGACPPPRWCASSWAVGWPWRPRGAVCLVMALAPSSWMTCGAQATRPAWATATTSACPSTTVGIMRTPGPSAQVPKLSSQTAGRICQAGQPWKPWGPRSSQCIVPVCLECSQCQYCEPLRPGQPSPWSHSLEGARCLGLSPGLEKEEILWADTGTQGVVPCSERGAIPGLPSSACRCPKFLGKPFLRERCVGSLLAC